jgi:hypothetical protein
VPGAAAALFQEFDIRNDHCTVGGLAHVVDREQPDAHRGERFHLDSGSARRFHRYDEPNCRAGFVHLELRRDTRQAERMAQRDQIACPFRGLDRADPGDSNIAFLAPARSA